MSRIPIEEFRCSCASVDATSPSRQFNVPMHSATRTSRPRRSKT